MAGGHLFLAQPDVQPDDGRNKSELEVTMVFHHWHTQTLTPDHPHPDQDLTPDFH